ncbi:hypothetical protein Tco_1021004 [Tanacetum coccineum]
MATVNQGMSVEEIKQIVAQRVANAIEAIDIYESINQTKQRENKVVGNAGIGRKSMLEPYHCAPSAITIIRYQRTLTCYECGGLGHYKRDYPELKNQNHGNQARSTEAREMVHALGGETNQDIDNLEYDINA